MVDAIAAQRRGELGRFGGARVGPARIPEPANLTFVPPGPIYRLVRYSPSWGQLKYSK
jgi:hypothetical protein